MTALIFNYDPDLIIVAMDTLAHTFDNQNFSYASKFYYFEEDRIVICGVGNAGLKLDWYEYILNNIINKDIVTLNKIAPQKLLEFDKNYPNAIDATLYQFGYNKEKNEFEGYAYRKSNNFISQELVYGFGTRPEIEENKIISVAGTMETISNKSDLTYLHYPFIQIMQEQKLMDDMNNIENKVFIGGEIELIVMSKDIFYVDTIYNFDKQLAIK